MSDMALVVVGASGRMGQTLIRVITETEGVRLSGAVERQGAAELGRDAGELAGVGTLGVTISDDPLPVFAQAEGVLDFTIPAASVTYAGYAAQARIAHICGTTGMSAEDEAAFVAAVTSLIDDPAKLASFAEAALRNARARYLTSTLAARLEELYADLLRARENA